MDDSDAPELAELLDSGQTSTVIKLLMTWLQQAVVYLAEDQPVSGTVDTVSQLISEHQVRLHQLSSFTNCMWIVVLFVDAFLLVLHVLDVNMWLS